MPHLITKSIYPKDKTPEASQKCFGALSKNFFLINFGRLLVPAAVKSTPQGIKAMSIPEVKK
jgi:hypothetical protein